MLAANKENTWIVFSVVITQIHSISWKQQFLNNGWIKKMLPYDKIPLKSVNFMINYDDEYWYFNLCANYSFIACLKLTNSNFSAFVKSWPSFRSAATFMASRTVSIGWNRSCCIMYRDIFRNTRISRGRPFTKTEPVASVTLWVISKLNVTKWITNYGTNWKRCEIKHNWKLFNDKS